MAAHISNSVYSGDQFHRSARSANATAPTVDVKEEALSSIQSIAPENLLDRLFLAIRERSLAADSLLHTLCHSAAVHRAQLYAVGGLVRGLLLDDEKLGDSVLDIDLAVDGDPAVFRSALAEAGVERPTIHERFGTASVQLRDGTRVDLVRTRSERYPSPGALPVVSPAPIEIDLQRRDFTINAAAVALSGERVGELIHPPLAIRDLERRLIRTLHRRSFQDDPTRLIRAARYASRIGGTIERRTAADGRRDRRYLTSLSVGRFGDAWRLLLNETDSSTALELAQALKIPQSREPRWNLSRAVLRVSDSPELFWTSVGLLERDPSVADWLPRSVGMNGRERRALEAGAKLRGCRRSLGSMRRPSVIAGLLGGFPDVALQAAEHVWSGASGAAIARYRQRRSMVRWPISAARLVEVGVEPGPAIGRWLAVIEAAVWDGELDPDDPASVARMEQRIRYSR
jgi:tRNA nucleotidyltransferase (CCA-adding enzyme)